MHVGFLPQQFLFPLSLPLGYFCFAGRHTSGTIFHFMSVKPLLTRELMEEREFWLFRTLMGNFEAN
jgi:hypothetical protein